MGEKREKRKNTGGNLSKKDKRWKIKDGVR
jgi:hypothetical protein